MDRSFLAAKDLIVADRRLVRKLGAGRFASVWRAEASSPAAAAAVGGDAMDVDSTRPRAVKIFRNEKYSIKAFADEMAILNLIAKSPECENIVKMYNSGIFYANDPVRIHPWIEMRMEGGNAYNLLDHCRKTHQCAVPDHLVKIIAKDTAKGLAYLRNLNIIHGDIKPDNLLLDRSIEEIDHSDEIVVRISDFGSSMLVGSEECAPGTTAYRPPEVIADHSTFDCSVDTWSLGTTVFELLTGCVLFNYDEPNIAFEPPGTSDDEASDSDNDDDNDSDDIYTDDAADDDDTEHDRIIMYVIERLLGRAPKEIRSIFDDVYDDAGNIIGMAYPASPISLVSVLGEIYGIADADSAADLIMLCLRYRPQERALPSHLIGHRWFASCFSGP